MAVVQSAKVNKHDVLDKDEPFDEAAANEWVAAQALVFTNKVKPKLEASLAAAVLAVDSAEGLVKTEECVAGLEASQIFDMNKEPKDYAHDEKLLDVLCFTGAYPSTETVLDEWRQYVSQWRAPPTTMTPSEVYAAWEAKIDTMPTLAPHAMRQFSRPISSAACERVFSYLTHMDRSDRNCMKKETLRVLLFLRGNNEILDELVREANEARLSAGIQAAKRAR